jgi:hypothetical protein
LSVGRRYAQNKDAKIINMSKEFIYWVEADVDLVCEFLREAPSCAKAELLGW